MERSEAEATYAAGREPVVDALLMLSMRLEAQDARLAALAERVEELEQRLKRDSSNSSLPPSHVIYRKLSLGSRSQAANG